MESFRFTALAAVLTAVYFMVGKLSLMLAIPPGYATAVWPPSGIALAALVVLGPRVAPGVWLGALAVNATVEAAWTTALLIATGNTLEALGGAWLVRRHLGAPLSFARGTDVLWLVAAAAGSAVIAASIGTLALSLGRPVNAADIAYNWWTWWQGDVCGMVLIAPLLLTWYGRATIAWTQPRVVEFAAFAMLLLFFANLIFGRPLERVTPLTVPFLVLPLFVWAAFRFGQREVTVTTALVSVIAVHHTVAGRGPFATGTLNESLLALLLFMCVAVVMGLLLSAVLHERERALAELGHRHDELQERFRLMVENLLEYAIFMLDANGRVVSWNAGAEKIKGYRAGEIVGKDYAVFFPREDVEAGKPLRILQTAEREGRASDEGWRVRKDGSRFWADAVMTALRGKDGRLIGYGKVTRDLTERRRADAEVLAAKSAAEQASGAKSEFLARMSHELRTPLNSLLILAKLLADNPARNLDEKQVRYAQTIHDAGSDLLALINDVLDLSRIESGAPLVLSVGHVRFEELQDALERSFRQIAQARELQFSIYLDPGLPESIETDAQRLRQVLNNLLSNAFKFTPQGRVTLRVVPADTGRVAFEVADTGIGIPLEKREQVFEAFRQVDSGTTRRFGGTGLGLSISRELARILGGEIRIGDAVGGGSVFTLFLPLAAPPRTPGE